MAKRESIEQRKQRSARLLAKLRKAYPAANCALQHGTAFELLVATILSAQSTDETVNKVTPALFDAYGTPAALAAAELGDLERMVHATGFFRQKAKSIRGAAQMIMEAYGGQTPDDMPRLLKLPGVARKTANVVLGTWFGRNEGVVVDTHVGRLADRLCLAWNHQNSKDAVRIEQDLMRVIPQEDWTYLSHALIQHGRQVCAARKPACADCVLAEDCPSAGKAAVWAAKHLPGGAGKGASGEPRGASGRRSRR